VTVLASAIHVYF